MADEVATFLRSEVEFASEGTRCAAWLYRPRSVARPPVVLMAHGFGALREFRLPAYAERFARAGLAVFLFDYRHFGASAGSPRHLIHPLRQMDDWYYAIDHVRRRDDLDGTRMALWGTSFSGGHVIRLAAALPELRAIVAQVPFLEPRMMLRRLGWRLVTVAVWRGLVDRVGSSLGRPPRMIPIVAAPGRLGCLNAPGAQADYLRLVPAGADWTNACAARSVLALLKHRPLAAVEQIRCPALVYLAEEDPFVSAETIRSALVRAPAAEVVRIPGGHFDVYFGEPFERAAAEQTRFLRRHLGFEDCGS
jgi:uncharacterized protein